MADGITISAAAVSAIVGAIVTYLKMRSTQKVAVEPQPLAVETTKKGPYVTVGECQQHRCALEKRIDAVGAGFERVLNEIKEADRRSEARAVSLHNRIDPFIEKLASTSEAVQFLKERRTK